LTDPATDCCRFHWHC